MRLLFISDAFPPFAAGEADHALYLCRELARRGLDVDVLTTRRKGVSEYDEGLKIHAVMDSWSWWERSRLRRVIHESQPDVVLLFHSGWAYGRHPMITLAPTVAKSLLPSVHFVTKFTSLGGAPLMRLRVRSGLDLTFRVHSHLTKRLIARSMGVHDRLHSSLGTLLSDSDYLFVMSGQDQETIRSEYPELSAPCELDPPPPLIRILAEGEGEPRQETRSRLGVPEGVPLLAYFGYIYGGKGLETLVQAFAHLKRHIEDDVRLLLIGGTPPDATTYAEKLLELTETLGVREDVIVTGEYETGSGQASEFLRAADVAVLPFDDGAQLYRSSIAAAAAHGLPIVTTRSSGTEAAFRDRENVLLTAPGDAEQLATAISTVLRDHRLREELALGALDLAEEWFSWEASIDRTLVALRFGLTTRSSGHQSRVTS